MTEASHITCLLEERALLSELMAAHKLLTVSHNFSSFSEKFLSCKKNCFFRFVCPHLNHFPVYLFHRPFTGVTGPDGSRFQPENFQFC